VNEEGKESLNYPSKIAKEKAVFKACFDQASKLEHLSR
jgi:hypothetical protein